MNVHDAGAEHMYGTYRTCVFAALQRASSIACRSCVGSLQTPEGSHSQWLADDAMLVSTATRAAQAMLMQFETYCADNSLTISVPKTHAAIFGPIPWPPPVLFLQGRPLAFVHTATYTGITLTTTARDIFQEHYAQKERAARKVANGALALEQFVGPIPPVIGIQLFRSLVEPHLTYGCEVTLDIREAALAPLEKIQHAFLRRALNLGSHSQLTPLHSESGVWPLRYRRLLLALRYLLYVLRSRAPLPMAALEESFALSAAPARAGNSPSPSISNSGNLLSSINTIISPI